MIRSSVRSAGLALLLTMNGCGSVISSGSDARAPSLSVAEAALEGGSGQIALQVSEGVLRRSPNDVKALEIKGDALTLLGDYEQATTIFQALLAADPNSVRANIGLGRITLSKDPAAAEARFQTVLKRDPKNLTALNNLGIARDLQGHHADAQAIYRAALAVDPDLDSAQVNLALSMAMSGQGPAAIKLLESKANQPGAPVKVRHDYAVVLAMAGHRQEAERVLSENMDPEEIAQVLDNVTGTHTKALPPASVRIADDAVPPDVVQVPEVPAQSTPSGRFARATTPAPAAAPTPATALVASVPTPSVAAMNAAPPMVVRPRQSLDDSETPSAPPVTPVSAAITYQRPLAAPLRAGDAPPPADMAKAPDTDPSIVAPKVVAMPAARVDATTPPPVRVASAEFARVPLPEAPPPAPVLAPVPLPPSHLTPVSAMTAAPMPAPVAATRTETPAGLPETASRPSLISTAAAAPSVPIPSTAPMVAPAALGSPAAVVAPVAAPVIRPATVVAAVAAPHPSPVRTASTVAAPAMDAPATLPMKVASVAVPVTSMLMAVRPIEPTAPAASRGAAETPDRAASEAAVQFAATASEESARSFWQSLVRRFPDVLGRRSPVVIRYERGGTVFWRVRTDGFDTVLEAQTLCARMRAGGQDCFVPRS